MCLVTWSRFYQSILTSVAFYLEWYLQVQFERCFGMWHLLVILCPVLPNSLVYSGNAPLPLPPFLPAPPRPAPPLLPWPPCSCPAEAASCLVNAGASEQETGPCTASCLSQTAPVLTRSMWQCGNGYTELTERVTLLDLDFASPFSDLQGTSTARCALIYKPILYIR